LPTPQWFVDLPARTHARRRALHGTRLALVRLEFAYVAWTDDFVQAWNTTLDAIDAAPQVALFCSRRGCGLICTGLVHTACQEERVKSGRRISRRWHFGTLRYACACACAQACEHACTPACIHAIIGLTQFVPARPPVPARPNRPTLCVFAMMDVQVKLCTKFARQLAHHGNGVNVLLVYPRFPLCLSALPRS